MILLNIHAIPRWFKSQPCDQAESCAFFQMVLDGKKPTSSHNQIDPHLPMLPLPKRKQIPFCSIGSTQQISPAAADAWATHQKFPSKSCSSSLQTSEIPVRKHPKSGDFGKTRRLNSAKLSSITIQEITQIARFLGWWLSIEGVVVPAKGEILNVLPSDSGICEVKCSPIQTPSVSVSSKPECLTKRCVLPRQQMTQSGTQAKLICEFKRTSLKPFSSRNGWDVNVSVPSGTVHLKVWRTCSENGDSASHYETQTTHFGYLIICLFITQNYS